MKKLISLAAIALVSSGAFANLPTSSDNATVKALSSAWKHQAPVTVGNNNLTMVYGGQDISTKSMLEGPVSNA